MLKKACMQKGYMNTEELLTFIKEQLSGCSGNVFIDRVLEDISAHIAKRPLFVPEKFKQWFIDRNVLFRTNPLAFVSKCGIADIDKGVFDKQIKRVNLVPLCNAMRERGVAVGDETLLIEAVENYILGKDLMSEEELYDWNHVAIEYISKLKNPSTKQFVLLFEKSKKMQSLKLPLSKLRREVEKINADWNATLKAIEEVPHGNEGNEESEALYEEAFNKINNPST